MEHIYVSSSGNLVGGLNGIRLGGSAYNNSVKDLSVYAGGDHYAGGLIGYAAIAGTSDGNVLGNVTITAPKASEVGGLIGRADYVAINTDGTYIIQQMADVRTTLCRHRSLRTVNW